MIVKKKWEIVNRWSWYFDVVDEEWIKVQSAILTNTHTCCSCWMCRNCRMTEGVTLQEHRNNISFQEQIQGL
jgi:hypothetical protein